MKREQRKTLRKFYYVMEHEYWKLVLEMLYISIKYDALVVLKKLKFKHNQRQPPTSTAVCTEKLNPWEIRFFLTLLATSNC